MNSALLLISAALAAGYVSQRLRAFPDGASTVLNQFVVWICLPAVVLRLVPKLSLEPELLVIVATPWLLLGFTVALVRLVARPLGFSRGELGVLMLCLPLGNTSFLGFPMIAALVGEDAVGYAVLYDQFGSFLILATYGTVVIARASSDEAPPTREIVRRVFRFPPFIALVVALLPFPHPEWLDGVLEGIGAALVPVAMFSVGLVMQLKPPPERTALALGLAYKLLAMPLVAWGIAHAFGPLGTPHVVAVLEAGMPSSVTAGALAMMAGLAPRLAASLVGYGILLSLVTQPLIARMLL
jgi:malate permease and related proteins